MLSIEAASNSADVTIPASGRCPFRKALGSIRAAFTPTASKTRSPFVSLSKFVVGDDKIDEVKEAFRQRPHLVDDQPGFVRMEVISPIDRPEEIWLITYWTGADSFRRWHRSHLYQDSHRGIPKGLKLVSGQTEMREFEHICS
jgi:heme oxygenase (mycobilin-producing)